MFARDRPVLFRNKMKLFYWLEMTLVRKLTNRMASFLFGTIRNRHIRTQSKCSAHISVFLRHWTHSTKQTFPNCVSLQNHRKWYKLSWKLSVFYSDQSKWTIRFSHNSISLSSQYKDSSALALHQFSNGANLIPSNDMVLISILSLSFSFLTVLVAGEYSSPY